MKLIYIIMVEREKKGMNFNIYHSNSLKNGHKMWRNHRSVQEWMLEVKTDISINMKVCNSCKASSQRQTKLAEMGPEIVKAAMTSISKMTLISKNY